MFGLSTGELFVVGFVTLTVLAAPYVPRLGQAIGGWFERHRRASETPPEPRGQRRS